MRVHTSARGQAIGIARMLGALIAFAMLWGLLSLPFSMIKSEAQNATSSPEAATGISRVQAAWDAAPFLVLVIAGFGLVALGIYQRGAP